MASQRRQQPRSSNKGKKPFEDGDARRPTPWWLASLNRIAPIRHATKEDAERLDAERAQWLLEVAWEGHRVVAARVGEAVRIFADDMREWTDPCAAIALAIRDLPVQGELVLEGFVCVLDEDGRPDFEALKERVTTGKGGTLVFMAWDCLRLAGEDLRDVPLGVRRARLRDLIPKAGSLVFSDALEGNVEKVRETVWNLGLPGVFARRLDAAKPEAIALGAADVPVELHRNLSAAPKVTNRDKVLFPRDGLTKQDLVAYYREVAPVLLQHMHRRPIVAQRWPDGIDEFTWYQHRVPPRAPDYLKAINIDGNRRLLIENEEALLWMVNQAALTYHGWASRVGSLENPDWVVIDLDPGTSSTWAQLIDVATAVRKLLELLEVESVVKTSGQKGLHVLVPIAGGQLLSQAHEFAERVCVMVAHLMPDVVSLVAETGPRRGRLFLDHLQNFKGKSLVLPYSVRAVDGAPVSAPVTWDEVTPSLDPKAFTVRTMRARLDATGDLFARALRGTLKLAPVIDRLRGR